MTKVHLKAVEVESSFIPVATQAAIRAQEATELAARYDFPD